MAEKEFFTKEDLDPLVVAAEKACEGNVFRKPGHLSFAVEDGESVMLVTRSRFDGDYGNICRLQPVGPDGKPCGKLGIAPTELVLTAMNDEKPEQALAALYRQWSE